MSLRMQFHGSFSEVWCELCNYLKSENTRLPSVRAKTMFLSRMNKCTIFAKMGNEKNEKDLNENQQKKQ